MSANTKESNNSRIAPLSAENYVLWSRLPFFREHKRLCSGVLSLHRAAPPPRAVRPSAPLCRRQATATHCIPQQ